MAFDEIDLEYRRGVAKKYSDLTGELHLVEINRNDSSGLGISLVGNKDLTKMSIFVNALKEGYPAANSGQIFVGDELLEVNGQSLFGRSHLNATPTFNAITSKKVKLLIHRSKEFLNHIAVPPAIFKASDIHASPQKDSSPTIIERKYTHNSVEQANENDNSEFHEVRKESVNEEVKKSMDYSLPNVSCSDELVDADDEVFFDSQNVNKCNLLQMKSSESNSTKCQQMFDDLRTCPILPGKVTKIEIKKAKMPLGCRIVGGIDMSLRRILVYEIYEGGAAAQDGRLKVADEILEINGENVHGLTHAEVLTQLRKLSPSIKLLVARDSSFAENLLENDHMKLKERFFSCKEFSIEFVKRPGKSLGISVVPIWRDRGVLVADVIKSVDHDGLESLLCGDEIVAINGMPLEHLATTEALLILKTLAGKLFMEVHRADVGLKSSPSNSLDLFQPYSPTQGIFKFSSASDLKKSKNMIKRALPSCFTNGGK